MAIGFITSDLDLNFLQAADPNDPLLTNANRQSLTTLKPGILISSRKIYLGLTATQGLREDFTQYTAIAGYRWTKAYSPFTVQPFFLYRINELQERNFDVGVKVDWIDMLFVGALYRSTDEHTLFTGLNFNKNRMGFTFSFNSGTNQNTVSDKGRNASMEFALILRISRRGQMPCYSTAR